MQSEELFKQLDSLKEEYKEMGPPEEFLVMKALQRLSVEPEVYEELWDAGMKYLLA